MPATPVPAAVGVAVVLGVAGVATVTVPGVVRVVGTGERAGAVGVPAGFVVLGEGVGTGGVPGVRVAPVPAVVCGVGLPPAPRVGEAVPVALGVPVAFAGPVAVALAWVPVACAVSVPGTVPIAVAEVAALVEGGGVVPVRVAPAVPPTGAGVRELCVPGKPVEVSVPSAPVVPCVGWGVYLAMEVATGPGVVCKTSLVP